MKKRNGIRIFTILFTVAIILSGFSGTTAQGQEGTEPTVIKYMTADFGNPQYSVASGYKGDTVLNVEEKMLELFNIAFEYEFLPSENVESVVMTRVAAGVDLPDVISYDFTRAKLIELYDQGIVIGLSDLVKENAPEIYKRYYEQSFEGLPENCNNDGELLRVVEYATNIQNLIYVLGVRTDWLDELGMDIPTTVDEFTEMLRAFRDNDMNGDGQNNEMFTSNGVNGMNRSLADAFGVKRLTNTALTCWYADESGKVYNTMLTDNTKNYIAYVNSLLEEGLLDPEFAAQTTDNYNEKMFSNRVGALAGRNWMASTSRWLDQNGVKAEYTQIAPLKQADGGDPSIYVDQYVGHKTHVVTSACADPEAVIKWLNWCLTPNEGSRYVYYGEDGNKEGGNWMRPTIEGAADYTLTLTEQGRETAKDPDFMSKIQFNSFFPKQAMGTLVDIAIDLNDTFSEYGLGGDFDYIVEMLEDCEAAQVPVFMMFPADEAQQQVLDDRSDLFLYMDEMFGKFMTGKEPLENWDAFIDSCKSMGLDEITAINQERYDSYNEKLAQWR